MIRFGMSEQLTDEERRERRYKRIRTTGVLAAIAIATGVQLAQNAGLPVDDTEWQSDMAHYTAENMHVPGQKPTKEEERIEAALQKITSENVYVRCAHIDPKEPTHHDSGLREDKGVQAYTLPQDKSITLAIRLSDSVCDTVTNVPLEANGTRTISSGETKVVKGLYAITHQIIHLATEDTQSETERNCLTIQILPTTAHAFGASPDTAYEITNYAAQHISDIATTPLAPECIQRGLDNASPPR
jgi:hypothetical protein